MSNHWAPICARSWKLGGDLARGHGWRAAPEREQHRQNHRDAFHSMFHQSIWSWSTHEDVFWEHWFVLIRMLPHELKALIQTGLTRNILVHMTRKPRRGEASGFIDPTTSWPLQEPLFICSHALLSMVSNGFIPRPAPLPIEEGLFTTVKTIQTFSFTFSRRPEVYLPPHFPK